MVNRAKIENWLNAGSGFFGTFVRDEKAGMLPLLAAGITSLVGMVGLTVDGARLYYAKDVLQKSLDAAGLAAGNALSVENMEDDARAYFAANMGSASEVITASDINITISDDNRLITLTGSVSVPATFMSLFGFKSLEMNAFTEITRVTRGMELALVMDNTGSMRSGGKIDAMKDAARDLIQVVYGESDVNPNLYVSLIPYTATVNIGDQHSAWLTSADQDDLDSADAWGPEEWKGCVMARSDALDISDIPPPITSPGGIILEDAPLPEDSTATQADTFFDAFRWIDSRDNDWIDDDDTYDIDARNEAKNNGTGPNLGCGPAITPLIESKSEVLAAIDEMLPWHRGGTTSNLGLVWGWRTLSPLWRGRWLGGDRPNELPLNHEEPFMDKVVVVLTDGQNSFYDWPGDGNGPNGSDFTAYDRESIFEAGIDQSALKEVNTRFGETCTLMKRDEIIIYSITFGSSPNNDTQELFRDCASNPSFYFHAPSNDELAEVFETIGRQLSNLRLSQ